MTDRKGNTDAPRVEEREVRSARTSGYAPPEEDRGTSWVSVVLGWLAALGAGLILSGIVSGIVGAIFGTAGRQGLTEGGTTALIGLLITLLLAFLIGSYAAGRMAARQGLKHGLLVPLLALAVTLLLAIVGGLLGVSFIDQLSGITLAQGAQQSAYRAAPQMMDPGPFLERHDTEEATRARPETYRNEAALKGHYKAMDLPTVVDASWPMEEVTAEILALGHPERPEYYASS
jgi:hypothetical protein